MEVLLSSQKYSENFFSSLLVNLAQCTAICDLEVEIKYS